MGCPDLGHFVTSQLRPFHVGCPDPGHFVTSQLRPFHVGCPDPGHFVTSQLRPFHIGCPDPGHGTKNLCEVLQLDVPTYYLLFRAYSGFGSTSHLLLGLCTQVRIFIRQCF